MRLVYEIFELIENQILNNLKCRNWFKINFSKIKIQSLSRLNWIKHMFELRIRDTGNLCNFPYLSGTRIWLLWVIYLQKIIEVCTELWAHTIATYCYFWINYLQKLTPINKKRLQKNLFKFWWREESFWEYITLLGTCVYFWNNSIKIKYGRIMWIKIMQYVT